MKWLVFPGVLAAALLGGFLSSAAMATSYPGDYLKIFGHSTSCAMGAASVNDETFKAGARTSNFRGCSSSNATRSVPPGYLGARALVRDYYTGAVCGASSISWNTSTTYTVVTTKSWSGAAGCSTPGYYYGQNQAFRDTDSDGLKTRSDIFSPVIYFHLLEA